MKIIDINAWLGNYPWRKLHNNTAAELVGLMDRVGIGQAVVSSVEAVFHNNPQPANEQLYRETLPYRDRLVPFATINPSYAGWEDDLRICHERWEMPGLRAFPAHHGYALNGRDCRALLAAARERGLPVTFAARLVDRRQHHWNDPVTDLDTGLLARTLTDHPDNRFMVLNSLAPADTWKALAGQRVLVDIARMTTLDIALSPATFNIPSLARVLGYDHIAFGSGMPFSDPHPALLKLAILQADIRDRRMVASENAEKMLGKVAVR